MKLKITPSKKLYYYGLPYRLEREWNFSDWEKFAIREVKKLKWDQFGEDVRVGTKGPKCYIYTKTLRQASQVCGILRDVVEVTGPINDFHKKVLTNDLKYDIKKTLYYKKYRYSAEFGYSDSDSEVIQSIRSLLNNHSEGFLAQDIWSMRRMCYPRLYIKGDKELMVAKLSFGNNIKTIKEAITIKEILDHGESKNNQGTD